MRARFIDGFDVILLDMGRTFMFDVDRFSDSEDYGATYCGIGGSKLSDWEVHRIISALFDKMLSDCRNPDYYDQFPSVLSYLKAIPESKGLQEREIKLLERVFEMHEVGIIPDKHAEALHQLHETHQLGVVSNIWSRSDLHLREFERAGIRDLFDVIIFSSDYGHIKPSPYLFTKAIEVFEIGSSRIVFVGDSRKRDIAGAKAAGLSAVWIDTGTGEVNENAASPDLVIQDLRDLLKIYT
jgi:HAD superfamily hydrolase (TIGR01509 family)